jgi:hypothetical protein
MERMDRMDPFMVIQIISAISYGFEIVLSGLLMEWKDRMDSFMVITKLAPSHMDLKQFVAASSWSGWTGWIPLW